MRKEAGSMRACAITDVGKMRQMNQDSVYVSQEPVGNLPNLFLVADGMGGHQAGDMASRMAVEFLLKAICVNDNHDPIIVLKECLDEMNTALWRLSKEDPGLSGMGTTLVGAVLTGDTLHIVNVGDSRLYLIDETIHQITRDHSLVEEMVAQGRMERGSLEYQARKNVITRAIGVSESVMADFYEVVLMPGERILMCSDGLSNMVTDEEMLTIVRREIPLEERTAALVEAANLSGGRDNITVILIER